MPRKHLMGPYRVDHLVLREEPEIERKKQKTKTRELEYWISRGEIIISGLLAGDFINFWRLLVEKRAETPVESISDPERKAMKTLPLLLLEVHRQPDDPHQISGVRPQGGLSLPLLLHGGWVQHLHMVRPLGGPSLPLLLQEVGVNTFLWCVL